MSIRLFAQNNLKINTMGIMYKSLCEMAVLASVPHNYFLKSNTILFTS